MSLLTQLDRRIRYYGGLVASYQPVPGGPLDNPAIVAAMALATEQARAVALRIEGLTNLQAVRPLATVPTITLIKRDLHDSPVRITPWIEDVSTLAQAGADIITIDGTRHQRPISVASLLAAIRHQGRDTIADRSPLDDALECWQLDLNVVGTTLSGYTAKEAPDGPDLALVKSLSTTGCRAVAEGRYSTSTQVAEAVRCGAQAVTVGSAIAHLEHICGWCNSTLKVAVCPANEQ